MGDGNLFRGTNIDQDSRFSDKQKKLLKAMHFDPSLSAKVNMEHVNLDVVKPWIHKRITEFLGGVEDEVLVAYIFELLEASKHPDPKELQIAITGFLNGKNARVFTGELWNHLVSAQASVGGVPAAFLEKKKEEIRKRKLEQESLGKTLFSEADNTATGIDERATRNSVLLAVRRAENVVRSMKADEASSRYDERTPAGVDTETGVPRMQMTEQKQIRTSLTGYLNSPAATPVGRDNKAGWYSDHEKHLEISRTSSAGVVLIGDSLISGLTRYPRVWNRYFQPLKALNFGLGGDRTQHVLWRVENGEIPQNTEMVVVHVGTNNTDSDEPKDIANGISSIAMIFQEAKPNCKVIITGLLPRDLEPSFRREKITKVNKYLKHFCASGHIRNFFYLKPDDDWVKPDGTLETKFYFQDFLHLVEEGDEKFAASIYQMITKIVGGQAVECEDTDVSADELEVAKTRTRDVAIPSFRSRSRSGSRLRTGGRSRYSASSSPHPHRPSRSPARRRSRSPRWREKRYSVSRSRSLSRSRSPKRRVRSQSRSPAPASAVLHDQRNTSSSRRRRVFKEDDVVGSTMLKVESKPADGGLVKSLMSDDLEAAKPSLSPTQYSKSGKTQTRTYRRQQSESEGTPEAEGPVLAPGYKPRQQVGEWRNGDARREGNLHRDRRRDSRDLVHHEERDAGRRTSFRSGERNESPHRKPLFRRRESPLHHTESVPRLRESPPPFKESPPRRKESPPRHRESPRRKESPLRLKKGPRHSDSPKRYESPPRNRSPRRQAGGRVRDYQPDSKVTRPPAGLARRTSVYSQSPENKTQRSPLQPPGRESPTRKRARREPSEEVTPPPKRSRKRESASLSLSPGIEKAVIRQRMVGTASRRIARESPEFADAGDDEESRRKVVIRKHESEESDDERLRDRKSKNRNAKPGSESESSEKEAGKSARPLKDLVKVSVRAKSARAVTKQESSDDKDEESDYVDRRGIVTRKPRKARQQLVPSESEDVESNDEEHDQEIPAKNPKSDRDTRRHRRELDSVDRATQGKQNSRAKGQDGPQLQQRLHRHDKAPGGRSTGSDKKSNVMQNPRRMSANSGKRSPGKKLSETRRRPVSPVESPKLPTKDAHSSSDDNDQGEDLRQVKNCKAEAEVLADDEEEVETNKGESRGRSQKDKQQKGSERERDKRVDRVRPRSRQSRDSARKSKRSPPRLGDSSDGDSDGETGLEVKLRKQALKSMKSKRRSSDE